MTGRERFLATMSHKPTDRPPNWEMGIWGQTADRWFAEGMPRDKVYLDFFVGEPYFDFDLRRDMGVNTEMVPPFDEETLEEDERYVIVRHATGVVSKALKEGTVRGTRPSMDQYLDFPVKDRQDFLKIKERYDPHSPVRYPLFWESNARAWRNRDYVLAWHAQGEGHAGLYWRARQWMGTEGLSLAFHDNPKLVHEMFDFHADFVIEVTKRALADVEIDYFYFGEDIAYKTAPLVSPQTYREFFVPRYKRMIEHLKNSGVKHVALDSDGNLEVLLPMVMECGFDSIVPCEIAAGMEPLELRRKFGRKLGLWGGIDKRALSRDKKAIEEEMLRKVPQLLEDGGYIPHLDHTFPPDIPYENFLYYLELKHKLLEGSFGS